MATKEWIEKQRKADHFLIEVIEDVRDSAASYVVTFGSDADSDALSESAALLVDMMKGLLEMQELLDKENVE